MAKLTVQQSQDVIEISPSVLMVHKQPPAMVVVVDSVSEDGQSFFGTDLELGVRIEYDLNQFDIFRGKLTLEQ